MKLILVVILSISLCYAYEDIFFGDTYSCIEKETTSFSKVKLDMFKTNNKIFVIQENILSEWKLVKKNSFSTRYENKEYSDYLDINQDISKVIWIDKDKKNKNAEFTCFKKVYF